MDRSDRVRPAAVAGAFYARNEESLAKDVEHMLADVPYREHGAPRILLSPHAGYVYSGVVAAHAYKQLSSKPAVVVIIGPSHFESFDYSSLFDGGAYATPLGDVPVDRDISDMLIASGDGIRYADAGHYRPTSPHQEHGLEVQLPFLQAVAPSARIVPIIMGDQSWQRCVELGEALAPLMERSDVVIVVSSDLSHFYADEIARRKDARFCELVAGLNPGELHEAIASRACEACGAGPMIAALIAGQAHDTTCHILKQTNSGDVSGDRNSVVGYAAAVITNRKPEDTS